MMRTRKFTTVSLVILFSLLLSIDSIAVSEVVGLQASHVPSFGVAVAPTLV